MPDALTANVPPRVLAAARQVEAALDALNEAAKELTDATFAFGAVNGKMASAYFSLDYPTACEHLRAAQTTARLAYRALLAGPERSARDPLDPRN